MKKLKAVFVAAVAALGLSACDFAGTVANLGNSVKDFASNTWNSAKELVGIKDKEKACEHKDENHDGTCDLCGETGLTVTHVDENNDLKCDICGRDILISSVELDTTGAQLAFVLNSEFSSEGLKVVGTTELGNKVELKFTTSDPDMTTVGQKVITVEYTVNGKKEEKTYTVDVTYWSEEDLFVLSQATLLGVKELTLPYMNGLSVEATYDEYEELESWFAVKEDATLDDLNEYYGILSNYQESVVDSRYGEIYFEFEEVGSFSDEELAFIKQNYGFEEGDFVAFNLYPYYMHGENPNRLFINDEYFVVGLTENNELRIYDRFVSALFEGYFSGTGSVDGMGYSVSLILENEYTPEDFTSAVTDIPYFYFSEFVEDYMFMPKFGNEEGYIFFSSFKGIYPFDDYFDEVDLSVEVDYVNGSEATYNQFLADLLELGYENEEGTNTYTLVDDYLGFASYTFIPYSESYVTDVFGAAAAAYYGFDSGFSVLVEYIRPGEEYVTKLLPEAERVVASFGELASHVYYEGDNNTFVEYADFYVLKEEEDLNALTVFGDLYSALPNDYFMDGDLEYDEEYECYYAYFTNGYTSFEMDVYDPDEDGDVAVELIFDQGYDILETFAYKVATLISGNGLTIAQTEPSGNGISISGYVYTDGMGDAQLASLLYGTGVEEELLSEDYTPDVGAGYVKIATQSLDGDYDVIITCYTQNVEVQEGQFVNRNCFEVYIEESAPWVGTAEEAFERIVSNLGIPAQYCSETDGVFSTANLPFGQLTTGSLQDLYNVLLGLASNLPKGFTPVSILELNEETYMYESMFVSADEQVVCVIALGVTSSGVIVGNITVCAMPA